MAQPPDDGFIGRWARRKEAARKAGPEVEKPAEPQDSLEELADENPDGLSDAELLEKLGLPDPDSLSLGDDFKQFLHKAVPQHIKRRALRRLWVSNPVLANLDGLNDYEDDYTNAVSAVRAVSTNYVVGAGFMKQVVALEEEASTEIDATPLATLRLDDDVDRIENKQVSSGDSAEPEPFEDEDMTEEAEIPAPRRMRFSVDDA